MINSNISVNGLILESHHKSLKLSMIVRLSVVLRRTVFDDINNNKLLLPNRRFDNLSGSDHQNDSSESS